MVANLYALAAVSLATVALQIAERWLNLTSVALLFVATVLLIAARFGRTPAISGSLAAALAFNLLFIPPTGTLSVADPLNWVALGVFLAVAITIGELSARAQRRADEADASRRESERLYRELEAAAAREALEAGAREGERLKAALLDAVTHNLRTPITSITAAATALLASDAAVDEKDRRELLSVIHEEADRLNASVGELIDIARLEGGQTQLERAWCSVEEVLRTAVGRVHPATARERIVAEVSLDLPVLYADASALAESLYQLIENALKYSPSQRPIRIVASQVAEGVAIAVSDEGAGIPEADRERIFDRFTRGDVGGQPGLGMGLAIARGLARAHGGDVTLQPRDDGRTGSRFVLQVPFGDDDENAPIAAVTGAAS